MWKVLCLKMNAEEPWDGLARYWKTSKREGLSGKNLKKKD
jgi:hypothetical protein